MGLNSYIVAATIPAYWGWTSYTPVIPKLYWDVYSAEERIKRLCKEYDKLCHYASMLADEINNLSESVQDTLDAFEQKMTEQLAAQDAKIDAQIAAQNELVQTEIANLKTYVDQKLADIAVGMQLYDTTTGTYRPSKEAMRRLTQALTFDNKGTTQLVNYYANKTVAEVAAQSVYKTAWSERQNIVIDDQLPA